METEELYNLNEELQGFGSGLKISMYCFQLVLQSSIVCLLQFLLFYFIYLFIIFLHL